MTKLEKMRELLAQEYQNHGCVKDDLVFANARTRWAAKDFEAGFSACDAQYRPIVEELVKALEFYVAEENLVGSVSGPTGPWDYSKVDIDRGEKARKALESVRSRL